MIVDIDARDNHPFVAIMAFPNERLSFIFQPDGTRMYPIFHHSIVPLFQF
jgi:hypothetical protein